MTDTTSDHARALAALRRRAWWLCAACGIRFEALDRPTQRPRSCSSACRQKLWRDAKRQDGTRMAPANGHDQE